ncbi:N-6 DNA methylase [Streptomyces mayteni]
MGENNEVTAAGIARLAGVGRAAVSNWRRRYENFPRPVGGSEASPTFPLDAVEHWLRDQGKLAEIPVRERLWQLVESDRVGPADAVARAGEQLLAHGDATPATPAGAGDQAVATAALATELGPDGAYEFLLGRHLDAAARQLTLTPPETAALMAAIAGPADSVLDPACGPCTLLAAARAHADGSWPVELYGQETDHALARLGGLRLALRGTATVHIRAGDSLLADAFPRLSVDAVLCHPPFNERNWGHDELTYDPRWEYGLPARAESELAWVQHALAKLRPGGTGVLLMPPAAASRRTGRRVRATLLRRGALRAVIALPAGAAPPHSLPLHLWVLRRPAATATATPAPRLLLVDTATAHRAQARVGLDWPTLRHTVLDAWHDFDRHGDLPERPGVHRALPVIDLLDDEVDLAPARHLPPPAQTSGTNALAALHRELNATLRRGQDLAPGLPAGGEAAPGPHWSTVTVGELARTGALELHLATAAGDPPPPARPGDVLVPLLDGERAARVVAENEGGIAPDRHTCLLRPDPDALNPWFLAGFLRGTANTRQASSYASSATRVDVRRLRVPRLPLATQRRYGRRFAELAAFETALHRAGELGRRLTQGTIDGLTEGTLPPGH